MKRASRRLAPPCLLVVGTLLGGVACRDAQAPDLRPLRIGLHSRPLSLDPHQHNEILTYGVLRHVYEGLTAFDSYLRLQPALAESWQNPNDLTWVFALRPNVRFHDGRTLSAADVIFSLERARRPQIGEMGSYLVEVKSVRAVGDLTVEVVTRRPYPILLNKLAFIAIVPRDSPERIERPVGSGPYRLEAAPAADGRLRLVAFADYWGPAAPLRRVELVPLADAAERAARLIGGDLDVAQDVRPADVARLDRDPCCRVLEGDSMNVDYLVLDGNVRPWIDRRVRQAVSLALDRQEIVRRSLLGYGMPAGQMVGRNVFGYAPQIPAPPRNLETARRLLTEAGYPHGVDAELHFRAGRDGTEIARQLGEAGFHVVLRRDAWTVLFAELVAGRVPFYMGGIAAQTADASDFFDSKIHSRDPARAYGDANFLRTSDPRLDALIEQSGTTLDMAARRGVFADAMRQVLADYQYIPLFTAETLTGLRRDVDWHPRLDGLILAQETGRRPARAPR